MDMETNSSSSNPGLIPLYKIKFDKSNWCGEQVCTMICLFEMQEQISPRLKEYAANLNPYFVYCPLFTFQHSYIDFQISFIFKQSVLTASSSKCIFAQTTEYKITYNLQDSIQKPWPRTVLRNGLHSEKQECSVLTTWPHLKYIAPSPVALLSTSLCFLQENSCKSIQWEGRVLHWWRQTAMTVEVCHYLN